VQHIYLKYRGHAQSILGSIFILILHKTLQTINFFSKVLNSESFANCLRIGC